MQAALELGDTISVRRSESCGNTPKAVLAQDIALALLGAEALDPALLADGVTWQKGSELLIGREAVCENFGGAALRSIHVDEVVTHGKAAAVSGKVTHLSGETALFCHMIRFTSASAKHVAGIVSFEHAIGNSP